MTNTEERYGEMVAAYDVDCKGHHDFFFTPTTIFAVEHQCLHNIMKVHLAGEQQYFTTRIL